MEFPFPFPAYEIQKDFMTKLYSCLENGKLGIFESPTGTGKSLSIICGAVKWLLDHEDRLKKDLRQQIEELDKKLEEFADKATSDWFSVQTGQLEIINEKQKLQIRLDSIIKYEDKMSKMKETAQEDKKKRHFRSKMANKKDDTHALESERKDEDGKEDEDDDNFMLEDYEGEEEGEAEEKTEEDAFRNTKIYFCSRTHSQLSQFVGEMKRSPYGDSVRLVSLASRLNYCVNNEVRRLRHVNLMNERCLQLQRKKTTVQKEKSLKKAKNSTGCPYLPGDPRLLQAQILSEIRDVEEVYRKAQDLKTCAYYTARNSVQNGQVIVVPYNSVLHKSTRTSSGIDLKGNVLIIDEAHNLLDAIERMHSSEITGKMLLQCFSRLTEYQNRYQSRFSAKNLLALNQLSFILKKLIKILGGTTKSTPEDKASGSSKLYKIEEFEVASEIDTINVFKLLDFVKGSKLCHKLQSYADKQGNEVKIHENKSKTGVKAFLQVIKGNEKEEDKAETTDVKKSSVFDGNPMQGVVSFLECLKSSCADGRIFLIPSGTVGRGVIKFILLNPASRFTDIVREARAVVLAGGTMEPISEFKEQLFLNSGATHDRIVTFSCDHVVPVENVLTSIVKNGPSGIRLEFNYQNRDNLQLLNELGRVLSNLCNVVPAGIVVFLPSYNYEAIVYKHLENTGTLNKISLKKRVFREPKLASQVDKTLQLYAQSIEKPAGKQNGALLFSVVGGKLSEGLNFSDDLGRCVVVVGMPYPNKNSPELQEKIKYLNTNVAPGTGNTFYENLCMKAVNQCIGRAVRHINDYASVLLLDARYANKTSSLPKWISRSLVVQDSFGTSIANVARFFAQKKKN